MKIIAYIWAIICLLGFYFTASTIQENIALSLLGLIPLAITSALFTIFDN